MCGKLTADDLTRLNNHDFLRDVGFHIRLEIKVKEYRRLLH
jgi:hypothetical protein